MNISTFKNNFIRKLLKSNFNIYNKSLSTRYFIDNNDKPIVLKNLKDKNNFNVYENQYINNIPIKMPYQNWKIPKNFNNYLEFIEKCYNLEAGYRKNMKDCYIYLTIDQRNIKNNILFKEVIDSFDNKDSMYICYSSNSKDTVINYYDSIYTEITPYEITKIKNKNFILADDKKHYSKRKDGISFNYAKLIFSNKIEYSGTINPHYYYGWDNKYYSCPIENVGDYLINTSGDNLVILQSLLNELFTDSLFSHIYYFEKIKCIKNKKKVQINIPKNIKIMADDNHYCQIINNRNETYYLNYYDFIDLYYYDEKNKSYYPKKNTISALKVLKPVTIINSKGYPQCLCNGDFVIKRSNNDIYGISKETFNFFYQKIH